MISYNIDNTFLHSEFLQLSVSIMKNEVFEAFPQGSPFIPMFYLSFC
jgi:hypothetical protein